MKKILSTMLVLVFIFMLSMPVFADSVTTTEETTEQDALYVENNVSDLIDGGIVDNEVEMEELVGHVEKKGWEVVGFIKTLNQPIMVIFFIVGLFFVAMGAMGNGSLMGKGLLVLFIVAIVYVSVFYAEDGLSMFREWIKME